MNALHNGQRSVVSRNIQSRQNGQLRPPTSENQKRPLRSKPSIKETIESCMSTGSQVHYSEPHQTIILFDWDDTLCPSTWAQEHRREFSCFRVSSSSMKYQRNLNIISDQVDLVLRSAMTMGKVIIVTNATEPWVEFSCKTFLPRILPLVMSLPVIYARSVFETQACEAAGARARVAGRNVPRSQGQAGISSTLSDMRTAPQRWKEVAFLNEIGGFYSQYDHQSWKNVISIGDSVFERDAVRSVVLRRPNQKKKCRLKTVKLLDNPSLEELIVQLKLLLTTLPKIVSADSDLNIEIDEDDLQTASDQ